MRALSPLCLIAATLTLAAACDVSTKAEDQTSETGSTTGPLDPEGECDPAGFTPCGACLLDGCESECLSCAADRSCVAEWDNYAACVEYASGNGYTTSGGGYYGTDEGVCYADYIYPYENADAWYQCQLSNFDACFDVCSAGTP
jgi:hypothetical protein